MNVLRHIETSRRFGDHYLNLAMEANTRNEALVLEEMARDAFHRADAAEARLWWEEEVLEEAES